MKVTLEFKKEDFWVGAYWRYDRAYQIWHLWICLLPCLPIHITWDRVPHEAKLLAKALDKARHRLQKDRK